MTRDATLVVGETRIHRSAVHDQREQRILAAAYAEHARPRCECSPTRPPMYLARIGGQYAVKRLPNTGHQHHPDCESWCPPEQLSGLAPMIGHAIQTGPTGTALRLGFSLSTGSGAPAPEQAPGGKGPAESAGADGTRLGLRSLLRYLWGEAGFDRWTPGMEHKRHWGVLSWHLRDAADEMVVRGREPLTNRLWIPEPFHLEQKTAITGRRSAFFNAATGGGTGRRTRLLLALAEVKEIGAHRGRDVLRLKHVPDLLFGLDEDLLRRMHSRFATEIELWQAHDGSHLIVLGTVQISRAGLPRFEEIALMTTNERWLPIGSQEAAELVDALAEQQRRFLVTGGYSTRSVVSDAVLTDTNPPTALHHSAQDQAPSDFIAGLDEAGYDHWHWDTRAEQPPLPAPADKHSANASRAHDEVHEMSSTTTKGTIQ